MRRLLLATLLVSALTAGAQGFVTHRAKVAKQQSEISAKRAATRGQLVAPGMQRGYFFVNCAADADAQQVARELQTAGAAVRMVRRPDTARRTLLETRDAGQREGRAENRHQPESQYEDRRDPQGDTG